MHCQEIVTSLTKRKYEQENSNIYIQRKGKVKKTVEENRISQEIIISTDKEKVGAGKQTKKSNRKEIS